MIEASASVMGGGASRTYYRRRKNPPRRVRIPSIVPSNEDLSGIEANLGMRLTNYVDAKDGQKMVDELDIRSESLGLWPATKIVEHNAGRCTVPGCKCIDFLALKYELLTCKCCGHHVKKHVMNKNRVPRETDPAYMPSSETDLAAQITNLTSTSGKFIVGQIKYANGAIYEGEIMYFNGELLRHGVGVHKSPTGELYSGGWHNDIRHGTKAKLVAPSGEVFVGNFEHGKIVGKGFGARPIDENKWKYVGEWFNGLRNGKGVMISKAGDCYEGNFERDYFHGYGVFSSSNGDVYEGAWKYGEITGFGTFTWKNGDKYIGDFVNGEFHGNGCLTTSEGRYEGKWNRNRKEGLGRLDLACNTIYIGDVSNNSINSSFGIIRCNDGDVFETRPDNFHDPEMKVNYDYL